MRCHVQYCNHSSIVEVIGATIGTGIAEGMHPYLGRRGDRDDVPLFLCPFVDHAASVAEDASQDLLNNEVPASAG